ncbi:hypothetical protein X777_00907 [Ooceraea biroi]|uniref:Uncharacterized protein n=1 Tax=Ooceraea biroi TaxID=2015173 RepID=A0A026WP60_OOCBI|nr:hypothetical protein X777_00907 [Ooceraea biroi]
MVVCSYPRDVVFVRPLGTTTSEKAEVRGSAGTLVSYILRTLRPAAIRRLLRRGVAKSGIDVISGIKRMQKTFSRQACVVSVMVLGPARSEYAATPNGINRGIGSLALRLLDS